MVWALPMGEPIRAALPCCAEHHLIDAPAMLASEAFQERFAKRREAGKE
jgi:hypothetical protein